MTYAAYPSSFKTSRDRSDLFLLQGRLVLMVPFLLDSSSAISEEETSQVFRLSTYSIRSQGG